MFDAKNSKNKIIAEYNPDHHIRCTVHNKIKLTYDIYHTSGMNQKSKKKLLCHNMTTEHNLSQIPGECNHIKM